MSAREAKSEFLQMTRHSTRFCQQSRLFFRRLSTVPRILSLHTLRSQTLNRGYWVLRVPRTSIQRREMNDRKWVGPIAEPGQRLNPTQEIKERTSEPRAPVPRAAGKTRDRSCGASRAALFASPASNFSANAPAFKVLGTHHVCRRCHRSRLRRCRTADEMSGYNRPQRGRHPRFGLREEIPDECQDFAPLAAAHAAGCDVCRWRRASGGSCDGEHSAAKAQSDAEEAEQRGRRLPRRAL